MSNDFENNFYDASKVKAYTKYGGELEMYAEKMEEAIRIANNRAEYFSDLAEKYKDEAKQHSLNAEYYAKQNTDVTFEDIAELRSDLEAKINLKQDVGDYAYSEDIPTLLSELNNDANFVNQSELLNAVPAQAGMENRFLMTDGKDTSWQTVKQDVACIEPQITNCLLEVPQRIKYELNDGVITLKAGSVFIFPYGTEDLSSTYPVGATFVNSNYKVIATQFATDPVAQVNQFFVWVELVNDTSRNLSGSYEQFLQMGLSNGTISWFPVENSVSGDTDGASGSHQWYDTVNNYNSGYVSGTFNSYLSLPIMQITTSDGLITSINKIFNGSGYMDKCYWVDKDLRGLISDGRNSDETLNNKEYTVELFRIRELPATYTKTKVLITVNSNNYLTYWGGENVYFQNEMPPISNYARWLKTDENQWYETQTHGEWRKMTSNICLIIAELSCTNGVISDFDAHHPFRAVDYDEYEMVVEDINTTLQTKLSANMLKASDGYCQLSNGLIIQWGFGTTTSKKGTVTLPTPFTTTDYRPVCQHRFIDGTAAEDIIVTGITTTTFSVFGTASDGATSFYWIAIGY